MGRWGGGVCNGQKPLAFSRRETVGYFFFFEVSGEVLGDKLRPSYRPFCQ